MDVESQAQHHKAESRRVGLEFRDNSLITGTLFNNLNNWIIVHAIKVQAFAFIQNFINDLGNYHVFQIIYLLSLCGSFLLEK